MEYLPPELVARIFSFLDPGSVTTCRQVCNRWRIISEKMTNPLYLPKVMGIVMQNMGFRSLMNCRRACKLWKIGLDQLAFNEIIYINGCTSLGHLPISDCPRQPFPSRIVKVSIQAPACLEDISSDNNDSPNIEDDPVYALLRSYGKDILYLQITLHNSSYTEKLFVAILQFLVNLRGLTIFETYDANFSRNASSIETNLGTFENLKFVRFDDSKSKLLYFDWYQRIVEQSPNLEHIDFHGHFYPNMDIVHLLQSRQPKMNISTLKIDIEDPQTLEILTTLLNANLPLRSLSIKLLSFGDTKESRICTDLLHNILIQAKNGLKRLELNLLWDCMDGSDAKPGITHVFPSSKCLTSLERLKLVGFQGDLGFLRDLKSLKRLLIVDFCGRNQNIFTSKEIFCQHFPNVRMYFPIQSTFESQPESYKMDVCSFMNDASYVAKYCGVYPFEFP